MKRFWLGVGLFLVLLSSSFTVLSSFFSGVARAEGFSSDFAVNAVFIDAAHINVKISGSYTTPAGDTVDVSALSGMYYDTNINDNTADAGAGSAEFVQGGSKKVGVPSGCQSKVSFNVDPALSGAGDLPAYWDFSIPPTGTTNTQCFEKKLGSLGSPSTQYTVKSTLTGTSGDVPHATSMIQYYVSDATHMNTVDNDPAYDSDSAAKFTLSKVANNTTTISPGDKFLFDQDNPSYGGQCPNYLQVTTNPTGSTVINAQNYDQDNDGKGCKLNKNTPSPYIEDVLVNTPDQIAQGNYQLPTTGGTTGTQGDPNVAIQDTCPLTEWWQLKWIACPIIESINKFISSLSAQVQDSLLIDVDGWFGSGPNAAAVNQAFNTFRALGFSILIAGSVAMVAMESSGFQVINALAFRRFALEATVSVIIISILRPVIRDGLIVVNELSLWLPDALYAPFLHIRNDISGIDGWSLITALVAGSGGLVALGPFGFLSFLVTGFFTFIMAAFIITIVKMILLIALILMPLALALRPIPNMKFLWDLDIKLVEGGAAFTIVVPIIFASGKILAIVLPGSSGGDIGDFLRSIGVFGCVVAPIWLIPVTAERTLGRGAELTGVVKNGLGKFTGGVSKYRQNTMHQRGQSWKAGSLYQDKGLRGRVNDLGRRTNLGYKGFIPGQSEALLSLQQGVDAENAAKANPRLAALPKKQDDATAVLALSGGSETEAASVAQELFRRADGSYDRARGEAALTKARAVGFNRANAAYAFEGMMQNKARAIGTGRIDLIERGAANLAGNNNDLYESLMYDAAFNARASGRNDLGGVSIAVNAPEVLALQQRAQQHGVAISAQEARSYLTTMSGMERTGVAQMMNGHDSQATADTAAIRFMLQHGSEDQQEVALDRSNEIAKNLSQASGSSQAIFKKFVRDDLHVDLGDKTAFSIQLAKNFRGGVSGAGGNVQLRANPSFRGGNTTPYADDESLARAIENGSRAYGNDAAYQSGQNQNQGGNPTP
ncbi:MAG TPA: hypothetical protein VLG16_03205 [Candidatus Saccharimonadales bacterium]|nr:hypothetical protein [Candidatus Saccharimonadales bacterium]